MKNLRISGASDDIVDFSGAINEEFYVRPDDTWEGWLQAPDGDTVRVKVAFTSDGWRVSVVEGIHTNAPWPYNIEDRRLVEEDDEVDQVLVLQVPDGTMVAPID